MSNQRSDYDSIGDQQGRAEQDDANYAGGRDFRAERAGQPSRTETSVRAEQAYRDWTNEAPCERPLAAARGPHAKTLYAVLRDHKVSQTRFAQMVGVDEKQVRKMLDGRVSIPDDGDRRDARGARRGLR